MFERLINLFKKGGAKIGMVEEIGNITEHPKIAINEKEFKRIQENLKHYKADYAKVEYMNSNNERKERAYHSLNVSKLLSRKLAKLVFNEGVSIQIADNKPLDDFIQEVFTYSKFRKNFGEELEAGYAVGGLVLRPYFDTQSKQIKISYSKPDSFFPLSSNSNDVSEMGFSTTTIKSENKRTVYYRLLEFHEWNAGIYTITNELWRSEQKEKLGIHVSLATLEKYADLKTVIQMSGFSRPLFVYIKLAGKNNKDIYSPLSLGIVDNSKQQIIDINDKYDQFMWEVKQAERKIIASDHFFKTRFDLKTGNPTRQFDHDTSAFRMVRSDEPKIEEFVPDLRSEQFIRTINFILQIVEIQNGFSPGTISFDGQSMKTATEIISENSETYSTRSDNVNIVEEGLKELIVSILELAQYHGLITKPSAVKITVDFDDGVFQSQESKLEYYGKNTALRFLPRYRAIMDVHKVSEETAKRWITEIAREEMGMDMQELSAEQDRERFGPEE